MMLRSSAFVAAVGPRHYVCLRPIIRRTPCRIQVVSAFKGLEDAGIPVVVRALAEEGKPPAAKLEFPESSIGGGNPEAEAVGVEIGNPIRFMAYRKSLGDHAFFLLAFIACTTSIAFTSLIMAAVPTLFAMRRTAISLAKLADTAREELPSTMAAVRLSSMELSDLTLELNDLSQEIADGVSKSAQAVQAAEAGIRKIGSLARRQTISIIQERTNLSNISLRPIVTDAAKKTSDAVAQAKRSLMHMISGNDSSLQQSSEHESNKSEP